MDLQAKLQYLGNLEGFQEEYLLDQKVTTIGRKIESDIVLFPQSNSWFPVNLDRGPDKLAVSREHARIVREKNEFYIEDVGSLVGTYVNGKKVGGGSLKEIYPELYIHGSNPHFDDAIREKNRGRRKLKNGDKVVLGKEIFSDNSRYQFVFKTQ